MSVKQERIEGIIRKEISEVLQKEIKDPALGFATITDVECTNDYSFAKVYVSFLGNERNSKAGLAVLNKAKGLIRSRLSKALSIRKTPELIFKLDETLEKGDRIESILHDLQKEEK